MSLNVVDKELDSYEPSENEEYMNAQMLKYFRQKLMRWRAELLRESSETLTSLQEGGIQEPDMTDRERKLIYKIDQAIQRIDEGEYGYCEETGDPIGIRRLMARPIATLSLEAQERHERQERVQAG